MTNLADELERLAKEATPGEWRVTEPWSGFSSLKAGEKLVFGLAAGCDEERRPASECDANAALIVTLRNNLPAILSALRGEQERETAADVVRAPRKLIEDVLTDYIMMAGQPRLDPLYARDVEKLGSRIGYGAMMQSASASWSATVRGGEFCVGPCRAVAISTRDRLAALLPPPPTKGTSHE